MAASPVEHRVQLTDTNLCVFEWPAAGNVTNPPTVLFVHATGFHGRCWDQVILALEGAAHVWSVDMRGHGRSERPTPPLDWEMFGQDVIDLVEKLDLKDIVAVGHSMGGHSITYAAGHAPDRFAGLVLVDPVIMSPEVYEARADSGSVTMDMHPIARRRSHFASVDEMYERYKDRGNYAAWDRQVFHDYCQYGLLEVEGEDDLQLACAPEIEAAIYMGSGGRNIHDVISKVQVPVDIFRARDRSADDAPGAFGASPTWAELVTVFARGSDTQLPDHSHFIPMEDPTLTAGFVKDMLDKVKANQSGSG